MLKEFFSQNLSFLRESRALSITYIGEQLDVSPMEIFEWENDVKCPNTAQFVKLADIFGVTLDRLITENLWHRDLISRQTDIKFLVLDVDGVQTDGGLYFTEAGDEFKKFNAKDGMAIKNAIKAGVKVGFLSGSLNVKLIQKRADILGVEKVYGGHFPKMAVLENWLSEMKLNWDNVGFIGDDTNDSFVMEKVGISACPKDAAEPIRQLADVVLTKNGGEGCVREFVDQYLLKI